MSDSKLYTDRLLTYWDPNLRGFTHEGYTHGATEVSSLCGDEVEFRLVRCPDPQTFDACLEIVDVWARGCCVCECSAAMLAELARGKSLAWLVTFYDADWLKYVNIPVSKSRKQCLMLPLHCLRKAVTTPRS